ncbi:type 2 lanthipeptide synthetase LanM [Salibacterium sp. K-3]
MRLSMEQQRHIAAQSAFLQERIHSMDLLFSKDEDLAETRFQVWKEKAGGDRTFLRRLEAEQLEPEQVKAKLTEVEWKPVKPLPAWTEDVSELFEVLDQYEYEELTYQRAMEQNQWMTRFKEEKVHLFATSLLPFLDFARQKFVEERDTIYITFTETAESNMIMALFQSLFSLLLKTLEQRFNHYVSKHYPMTMIIPPTAEQRYKYAQEFNQDMAEKQWKHILIEYPVMTRLMIRTITNWKLNLLELLANVQEDAADILDTFGFDPVKTGIKQIDGNLSDAHNEGKTVYLLQFNNEQKLIYKPRGLHVDKAWEYLLTWVCRQGLPCTMKTPKLLNKGDHGWVEHVKQQPLGHRQRAETFYFRTGILMGLVYTFGGNDFHCENMIACGEHPVLVDLETLVLPRARPFDHKPGHDTADTKVQHMMTDSVLYSGFLPFWSKDHKGEPADWSSLTSEENKNHRLYDGDEKIDPLLYEDYIVEGFEWIYDCLQYRKTELLGDHSPLSVFHDCYFRYLIRGTQIYVDVQRHTTHPDFLKNGLWFSLEIERLGTGFSLYSSAEETARVWEIFQSERQALERRDTPIFYGKAESSALQDGAVELDPTFFMETALERSRGLIYRMNEQDRRTQVELIRTSLSLILETSHEDDSPLTGAVDFHPERQKTGSDFFFLKEAERIYKDIWERRITGERDQTEVTWIVKQYDMKADKLGLSPMSAFLYDGKIGLSLFMAALYRMNNEEHLKDDVACALGDFRKNLRSPDFAYVWKRMSLGLGKGLAGIIKSLMLISEYLEDSSYLEDALYMAENITEERVQSDHGLDIIGGSAGLLSVLSELHERTNRTSFFPLARRLSNHLLEQRSNIESGHKMWHSGVEQKPLTGMGHGAAGYAKALLQWYEIDGGPSLYKAAYEAVDYENMQYNDRKNNWPDYRRNKELSKEQEAFMGGWCSGAPGIGLARLQKRVTDPMHQRDIQRALTFTHDCPVHGSDHVCCGNAGRIDLLLEAYLHGYGEKQLEAARKRATWMIERKDQLGHYLLNGKDQGSGFNPSFFQGTSGIGYMLLRNIAPDRIHSLLT